ncbi:MAG: hypothetical protein JWP81_2509 [Ferruginibacter sp.]|nr:hypothetical protein [Ferruginibacter sp.]
MIKTILLAICFVTTFSQGNAQIITPVKTSFDLSTATIAVDPNDFTLVKKAAAMLQDDIEVVTGKKIPIQFALKPTTKNNIFIGSSSNSSFIKALAANGKISLNTNQWEAFQVQSIDGNLIIAGSDRRGTAYGVLEVSKQIGVSPWYWWADVPVKKQAALYVNTSTVITDAPKVKYRGIFINDEAPALSSWSKEKFGGFNHKFYEKVFELILRLKGNYLWPAMWGNAFYDDDSLNIQMADDYGIVMGTSHHEPLMKAHDEWRRYGTGKWNYDSNKVKLQEFWRAGMQRATNEKIVSVGMRGDGDEPMSRETATTLLEGIVNDQRKIIEEVTQKPASETPQLWALYKEVQDYYEKGMRVPDDVTLLLCDDNWGNIRKLPGLDEKSRKGGYGIYYHFDYVGGPRNYKWLNTNPLPRIWEQMHLAWEYNARQIWIVNVGDIKPMELPISFFLDYAWDPTRIDAAGIQPYTVRWAKAQFGTKYASAIADLLAKYAKYNGRRKPELLDDKTYSFFYSEWERVVKEYNDLLQKATAINNELAPEFKDAFYQLVLHPIKACANLNEMYYNVALNKKAYQEQNISANNYADKVKALYQEDSLITIEYHQLHSGKWNHMMSQTHIGYTNWQQPPVNRMPRVSYLPAGTANKNETTGTGAIIKASYSKTVRTNNFIEQDGVVSIEAAHFTKASNSKLISWKVLPNHGRTGDAVTTFPVTAPAQKPASGTPYLEYEIHTTSKDSFTISSYFSPTLNFHGEGNGLQFAISVDDETPQVISINKDDKNSTSGIWNKWVSESIIIKSSKHKISMPGKHTIKYWMVNSGVVLQKLVADFGSMKPSYLGPPETKSK